jgi:hypothetical protein
LKREWDRDRLVRASQALRPQNDISSRRIAQELQLST